MPLIGDEESKREATQWVPGEVRWRRPKGCSDTDMFLEQEYTRSSGEKVWRRIQTVLED